jgi:hypothetical protein
MKKTLAKIAIYSAITLPLLSPAALGLERPDSGMSLDKASKVCTTWARSASKRGSRTLVIGFEGWISFNQNYAEKIYQYQDELIAGKSPNMPGGTAMNFVGKNLFRKHMGDFHQKVDYLLMPETSEDSDKESVSQQCIKTWYSVMKEELRLIIVSHSFGGNAARKLVQKLNKDLPQYDEIEMLTIDPRTPNPTDISRRFYAPENVRDNHVYFQKYTPFLWGYPFAERSNTSNKKLLKKDFGGSCNGNYHSRTTCAPEVVETYLKLISRTL